MIIDKFCNPQLKIDSMQKKTSRRCHLAICGGNTAPKEKKGAVPYGRSNILVPEVEGVYTRKRYFNCIETSGKVKS
jgi:hypothetical protein